MAPIDGAIGLKLKICNAYTSDVNISKAQPSKASGLGGVASQRSKSAPILYKYRLYYGISFLNCVAIANFRIIVE